MNEARSSLLAGPRLACQQHAGVRKRNGAGKLKQILECSAFTAHAAGFCSPEELLSQLGVFF